MHTVLDPTALEIGECGALWKKKTFLVCLDLDLAKPQPPPPPPNPLLSTI